MPDPDLEARVSALEARVEMVAADASAARHLAAANDRDYADLTVKVDAHRRAINALGEQHAARFDRVDSRFDRMDSRIDRLEQEMRVGFAQAAAGQQQIVDLLTGQIEREDR